ncbi:MAG: site-specific integrase [Oligoflexales bacterium]|nr:site-specific integrase [Oligoflexales bacterium]
MAIVTRRYDTSVRYCVRVRDQINNYYPSKTFDRKVDAEQYERQLKLRKDSGSCAQVSTKLICVSDYFSEWLEYRRSKLSKGWFQSVERMYNTYIIHELGILKLADVKSPHIGKLLAKMQDGGMSPQSILHVFNILNKAFKDAVEYFGYLNKNPVLKQDRPKIRKVERSYLTPEESWKLLDYCKDHFLAPAIWLAVLSGLRPSEVQALQWRAIDFEKGQILICAAYKRGVRKIEPFPKQGDWAIVPMPTPLSEFLSARYKHRFPADFVAPATEGGLLDYTKFHRNLWKLCDEAGVKRVSPHELRHSCTEIWFRSGASLEDVRRLLNHKTATTTQRYVHRTDDRLSTLAKAIASPH